MVVVRELIKRLGGGYASELGIELARSRESEVFKWFLASFLYGARISEKVSTKTYREFAKQNVSTPRQIQDAGWDGLVRILDAGGYVRYDFSTASKLLLVSEDLIEHYGGKINAVHAAAEDPRDLEDRLQAIGKGIGPVTANIFLRELRGIWPKARPLPSEPVILAARHLGLVDKRTTNRHRLLGLLEAAWEKGRVRGCTFVDFEAGLSGWGVTTAARKGTPLVPWRRGAPRLAEKQTLNDIRWRASPGPATRTLAPKHGPRQRIGSLVKL